MRKQREMFCSFCGKSQHDVKKLIAGPKVFICDECVEICIETLGYDREWCDREIANLKRLRQQARDVDPNTTPSLPKNHHRRAGWFGRLMLRFGARGMNPR
jgi:hypothetical protein